MRSRRYRAARVAAIALGLVTFFGIVAALLAPPQVSQGNSFPAPAAAVQPHKQPPPAPPVNSTKCYGKFGTRHYAADQADLAGPNFAGPPLVEGRITKDEADLAVGALWSWLCWDPVNTAVFAAAFGGEDHSPVVLYTNQQWASELDYLRAAGDWTGTYIAPKLVYRSLPKGWATDYMIAHQPNGVPDVGYEHNPNGKSWYLKVYDMLNGDYVFIRVACMQPIRPHAPPDYLHATGGQLGVAVTPTRSTSVG